ncbi:sulfite exporter TauE/SafE family protein [bacterium]|nr:sulfite exporter TauE/SafE family protein [bacterium]
MPTGPLLYATIGLLAGLASGCFGIGGGALIVPALTLLCGVSPVGASTPSNGKSFSPAPSPASSALSSALCLSKKSLNSSLGGPLPFSFSTRPGAFGPNDRPAHRLSLRLASLDRSFPRSPDLPMEVRRLPPRPWHFLLVRSHLPRWKDRSIRSILPRLAPMDLYPPLAHR